MNDIKAFEIVEVKPSDFKIHFIFKLFADAYNLFDMIWGINSR